MLTPDQAALLQLLSIQPLLRHQQLTVGEPAGVHSPEQVNSPEPVNIPASAPCRVPVSNASAALVATTDAAGQTTPVEAGMPVPAGSLQQDVLLALSELGIAARWHYQAGARWQLNDSGLITDHFAQFAQGHAKRALWQLLCQHAAAKPPA